MNFQSKLPEVGTTIFTVMSKLASDVGAINLSQGFPDYPADGKLKSLVAKYVNEDFNQYAPMRGTSTILEAISEKCRILYGAEYDPYSEITITTGATEAIFSTISALIKPGDEVIILEPAYNCYIPAIRVVGGKPVAYRMRKPNYTIDWNEIESLMTDRTRMIMINTPNNPTASALMPSDMESLERLVVDRDVFVLSDEVYHHLIFDGLDHESILKYPRLRDKSIAVYSFGKTFHTTGWRIGYCVASAAIMAEIRKVHQFNVFSSNHPVQRAIAEYMEDPNTYLNLPSFFEQKRDLFLDAMKGSSFRFLPCKGTYFVLAEYESINDLPDKEFATWLTQTHGVAVIPISVFYSDDTDEKVIRFCFCKEDKTLLSAAEKLRHL